MALTDYTIDTSGSPDDVKRRQAYAQELMKQGGDSSPIASPWQGVNRLAQGLLGGYQQGQARQEEQQGRSHAQQLAAGLLGADGKVNQQAYVQAASDPWVRPEQLGAVGKVADWQHTTARDAVADKHQSVMEGFARRAADRADQTPLQAMQERGPAAEAAGLEPGTPAYTAFLVNGKLPDTALQPEGTVKSLTPGGELYHLENGKVVVDHKNDRNVNVEEVSPETLAYLADRVRMGDPGVKIGYGRNPGMIAKIDAEAQKREAGGVPVSDEAKNVVGNKVTLSARGSAERKLGTINTNNEFFGNNALGALDIAEKASGTVDRTNYPGVNKALNAYRTQTGDPKTVALGAALNTVVNDYAKFTGGGVGSDSLRGHAEAILNGAHSHEQLKAIVHMMRTEIKRGQQSPSMVRSGFDELYAPKGSGGTVPAQAPAQADPLGIR